MKQLLIAICTITILAIACNKQRGYFYYVPSEIKDKINWQPGSYWIMEDSATHRVDSFYVTSYETNIKNGSQDDTYEQIKITIQETCISQINTDSCFWRVYVGMPERNNLGIVGVYNNCSLGAWDYAIAPSGPISDDYVNYNSQYTLNGITYNDVYVRGIYPVPDTGYYFNTAFQDGNGPVYLGYRNCGYNYNWFLKRKNIVRN